MKICVYGAGVIGGILASSIERAGHDVSVITRGEHLEAIRKRGLTVRAPGRVEIQDRAPLLSQKYCPRRTS